MRAECTLGAGGMRVGCGHSAWCVGGVLEVPVRCAWDMGGVGAQCIVCGCDAGEVWAQCVGCSRVAYTLQAQASFSSTWNQLGSLNEGCLEPRLPQNIEVLELSVADTQVRAAICV